LSNVPYKSSLLQHSSMPGRMTSFESARKGRVTDLCPTCAMHTTRGRRSGLCSAYGRSRDADTLIRYVKLMHLVVVDLRPLCRKSHHYLLLRNESRRLPVSDKDIASGASVTLSVAPVAFSFASVS